MNEYRLLDFGAGRKLERFGPYVLDRPSPAAEGALPAAPELWPSADARFIRSAQPTDGQWQYRRGLPESWQIADDSICLEVRLTPFGHVGLFPEQKENWDWISHHVKECRLRKGGEFHILNLFAYTGGSTLAAAAAGACVTHLDGAKNIVEWARRNAALSGLSDAPIRWIVEDARKFVARELRRGNRYDAVILDPPSYGHGPKGEIWKIDEHLLPLLSECAHLTEDRQAFFVLTCHSPGYSAKELSAALVEAGVAADVAEIEARLLELTEERGRTLSSGFAARWAQEKAVGRSPPREPTGGFSV
jgi:23S rRNA (cytosine1962-C5)-methyltransferase